MSQSKYTAIVNPTDETSLLDKDGLVEPLHGASLWRTQKSKHLWHLTLIKQYRGIMMQGSFSTTVCMYACMYVCMYVYMYVCMYVYVYI